MIDDKKIAEFKEIIKESNQFLTSFKRPLLFTVILFGLKAFIFPSIDWVWVVAPIWGYSILCVLVALIAVPILNFAINANTSEARKKLDAMQESRKVEKENGRSDSDKGV